jgi:PAS domain S-box-containing protein
MSAPPVEGVPSVLYVGPDSDDVARRWADGDRPFDLRTVALGERVGEAIPDGGGNLDCVVCRQGGDGAAVNAVVSDVRAADADVPVVVFADDLDVGAAMDLEITHSFTVCEPFDAVEHLEQLAPLVERTRRHRREESMLDSLLEHIPLSVYFKDPRSRHVRVSDRQPQLTGDYLENDEGKRLHTPEDVVGKTEFDIYTAENAAESVAVDEDVMDTGEPAHSIEHIDGGQLDGTFVSTFKAPWYEDGEVVGTLGITSDISERKQYEHQLERQNERLERFASVVSHDLRNPLEVAFGRLEFAQETGETEHFEALERALDRMDALITDVLTLARQGETVDDAQVVAIDEAATEAWALVETADATLSVDTDMHILADLGRLQELLENVFRNAIEHGGDDVAITVGAFADGRGFFVADDGPGIDPEDREAVFDSGFSTSDDGTGLGLSIVRTIAEAHGWSVRAAESETGGARFEFGDVQRPE